MLYDAQVHQLQKVRSVLVHGCGGDRVAEVRAGLLQGAVFVSVWYPPCVFVSFVRPSPLTSTLTAVGVLLGFILLHPYDLPTMHAHLLLRMADTDLSALRFPEFDFDLSRVEAEWARLRASMGIHIPEVWKLNKDGREFRVGEAARGRGLRAVHPVVIVPGIISTVRPVVFFFCFSGCARVSRGLTPTPRRDSPSNRGRPPPSTGRFSATRCGAGSGCSPRSSFTASGGWRR